MSCLFDLNLPDNRSDTDKRHLRLKRTFSSPKIYEIAEPYKTAKAENCICEEETVRNGSKLMWKTAFSSHEA